VFTRYLNPLSDTSKAPEVTEPSNDGPSRHFDEPPEGGSMADGENGSNPHGYGLLSLMALSGQVEGDKCIFPDEGGDPGGNHEDDGGPENGGSPRGVPFIPPPPGAPPGQDIYLEDTLCVDCGAPLPLGNSYRCERCTEAAQARARTRARGLSWVKERFEKGLGNGA
jgi:hypothetical protein